MKIDYKEQWRSMTGKQQFQFLMIVLIAVGTMLAIMN